MINLNETVTVRWVGRLTGLTSDTFRPWEDFDQQCLGEIGGLSVEAAIKVLDIRTRRIAEALNRDPGDISEFMRERFGK